MTANRPQITQFSAFCTAFYSFVTSTVKFGKYRVGQKSEATNFCLVLTDLQNFSSERFFAKFAVTWLLKILPLLAYVATVACETLVSENKRLTIKR